MRPSRRAWAWARSTLARVHRDRRGIESIEYLLIAALVIIAAASAWRFLGQRVAANVNAVAGAINTGTTRSIQEGGLGGGGGLSGKELGGGAKPPGSGLGGTDTAIPK